jgi:signal transduction histidine kinase
LQWLEKPDSKADKKELFAKAAETLDQAYSSLKEISNNLSPHILQNFGLKKALLSFIDHLKFVCPITFDLICNIDNRLVPETEIAIYRIHTECINNTIKHSEADKCSVSCNKSGNSIQITYFDNGKGFDSANMPVQSAGKGLYNIKTRLQSIGGTMSIESEPGQGVKMLFTIPI